MRRLLFSTIAIMLLACMQALGSDFAKGPLRYNVHWHWGLINMHAGQATLQMQCQGSDFFATFTGQSVPWEGRIYCVDDTLQATVNPRLQKIDYINAWYRKPKVNSAGNYASDYNPNLPCNYRNLLCQGDLNASAATMEAITITADMLSIYYYARILDFSAMQPGQRTAISIMRPGQTPDRLEIVYNGMAPNQASGRPAYSITFNFSYEGCMSRYPVLCYIDTASRVPTYFAADIKIGHVAMSLAD